eukprot:10314276-Ditylum_brightwellii.AAC.1
MEQGHQKGERYILAGNFNEPIHSTSGTLKLCSNGALQLVDILSGMTEGKFSTRKTRKDMINNILMSPELAQSIWKKGYQSFDQIVFTDHRGMYLDLDTAILFGADTADLMSHNACSIRTKDPQCMTKYITTAHQYLTDNNYWKNIDKLIQSQESNQSLAEKLDTLLIQACVIAERKCGCKQTEWWSLLLICARCRVHILNLHLTKL